MVAVGFVWFLSKYLLSWSEGVFAFVTEGYPIACLYLWESVSSWLLGDRGFVSYAVFMYCRLLSSVSEAKFSILKCLHFVFVLQKVGCIIDKPI